MKRAWPILFVFVFASACGGGKTLEARMDHAEDQGRAAEAMLDEADQRMQRLEADRAQELLEDAKEKLADPDIAKYPEHKMLRDRLKEGEAKLVKVREEIAKRELERAVLAQRAMLETAVQRLEAAMKKDESELRELKDATEDLQDKLKNGAEIEAKDKPLADYAATARKVVEKAKTEIERDEKILAFKEGPGVLLKEANELFDQSKQEKDKAKQRELDVEALDRYRNCATKAKGLVGATPELAKVKLELEGKPTTPDAVASFCEKQGDAIQKKLEKKPAAAAAASAAPAAAKKKPVKKKKK